MSGTRIKSQPIETAGLFNNRKYKKHLDDDVRTLMSSYESDASLHSLLDNTLNFLNATTLDDYFKKLRDGRINNDENLKNILNKMAVTLKMAETQCDQETKSNVNHARLFSAGINYCIDTVKQRLDALKDAKDHIYELFDQLDAGTKHIMQTKYGKTKGPK